MLVTPSGGHIHSRCSITAKCDKLNRQCRWHWKSLYNKIWYNKKYSWMCYIQTVYYWITQSYYDLFLLNKNYITYWIFLKVILFSDILLFFVNCLYKMFLSSIPTTIHYRQLMLLFSAAANIEQAKERVSEVLQAPKMSWHLSFDISDQEFS